MCTRFAGSAKNDKNAQGEEQGRSNAGIPYLFSEANDKCRKALDCMREIQVGKAHVTAKALYWDKHKCKATTWVYLRTAKIRVEIADKNTDERALVNFPDPLL